MAIPVVPFQELTSQAWQLYQQQIATTQSQQPVGSAIQAALASAKDFAADRVRLGIKARFPGVGLAPSDALTQLGAERQITQNPGEADIAFAVRVLNAWNVWPYGGTARGVLRALYDAGYPNTAIVQQLGGYYALDVNQNLVVTASSRWTFDGQSPAQSPISWSAGSVNANGLLEVPSPLNGYFYRASSAFTSGGSQPVWPTTVGASVADGPGFWVCQGRDFWSRFSVLFLTPFPASWGGTPPAYGTPEVSRLRSLVNQWRSAHSTCVSMIVLQTGKLLGYPIRTLGSGGTLGGAASTIWTPV